ncbi:MAG: hypothetical protein COA82_08630 [Alkaliphilus sp.]|nr:hypothetical protein [Alkaliphilus sp. AH-315-G20]PHS33187.1 MAG: hypothetical protein COA82_08630 [Alkaliphilus sp.]
MNADDIKLGNIASITSGLVVKRKQVIKQSELVKKYRVITLKSLEQSGYLNMEYLEELKSREILDGKYITRLGDIIVRLSSPNTAVTIGEHETGLIISSLFVVVRLSSNVILPEYLGIFLNTEQIKRIYAKSSAGSVMQIIRTSVLKDINVKAVSTENQEKIIGINKLILREKKLLEELIDKKNKYHSIIINKIFKDRLLSH